MRRVIAVLLVWVFAALPAAAQDGETVPYDVEIAGVKSGELRPLLRQTAQLVALKDPPPATLAGLRRRATGDVGRLEKALKSRGFHEGAVEVAIDPETDPVTVVLRVDPGPVYLLETAEASYTRPPGEQADAPRTTEDLNLTPGQRAEAARIIRAQRGILTRLENSGHPLAEVENRRAVADRERDTITVSWTVDPGPFVRFGAMRITGLETVERGYLDRFRRWEPGEPFDRRKVEATRERLMETGLFRTVVVERGEIDDGRMPVTLAAREGEQRSIGFTGSASTDEGPRAEVFWQHRNILGGDEDLEITLGGSLIDQEVETELTLPNRGRLDQDVALRTTLHRQDTDAFEERSVTVGGEVTREGRGPWTLSAGTDASYTETEDNEGFRTFFILGAPFTARRDTRDNLLDPTQGSWLSATTEPVITAVDETEVFLRNTVSGRVYRQPLASERLTLAGRARYGWIGAGATDNLPSSKRFYAGGAGSVRGFGFQDLGPITNGDPDGGRSLVEASAEARVRVSESVGVVPFLDAGQVYDDPFPNPEDDAGRVLRVGAGLGVRYFTPIGPVRVDVAVPVNDRPRDSAFELYIGLGQAF